MVSENKIQIKSAYSKNKRYTKVNNKRMTLKDKDLQEKAREYCDKLFRDPMTYNACYHAFLAGHASRDEEITALKDKLKEADKWDELQCRQLSEKDKKITALREALEELTERWELFRSENYIDDMPYTVQLHEAYLRAKRLLAQYEEKK